MVEGLLNKQIAAKLELSEASVKFHRGHVMQKMRADSIADLVRVAEKLRILAGRVPCPPSPRTE